MVSSIRGALISLLVVLFLPGSAAFCQLARNWLDSAAAIDRAAPILIGEHHTPGVSVALVEAGKFVWTGCYGIRAEGDPAPVTADTVFEACSMSKPLFAYGFLKLVEKKQFDLDKRWSITSPSRISRIRPRCCEVILFEPECREFLPRHGSAARHQLGIWRDCHS